MLLLRVASKMIEWPAYCCVGWLAISSPADRQIERESEGERSAWIGRSTARGYVIEGRKEGSV